MSIVHRVCRLLFAGVNSKDDDADQQKAFHVCKIKQTGVNVYSIIVRLPSFIAKLLPSITNDNRHYFTKQNKSWQENLDNIRWLAFFISLPFAYEKVVYYIFNLHQYENIFSG